MSVLLSTLNHPAATGSRGQYQIQLNPSDSALLNDEPVVVRRARQPYASGGSGNLLPGNQPKYIENEFPWGPLFVANNDTGIFNSGLFRTEEIYYLTAKYPGSLDYQYAISAQVNQVVGPGTTTTTTVASIPASGITTSTSVTITATVSPSDALGTMSLYSVRNGVTTNYTDQAVSSGVATFSIGTLASGNHLFVATFNQTPGQGYVGSAGSLGISVDAPAASATTTSITAPTASTIVSTSTFSVAASVSPSASGTFELFDLYQDATTSLGSSVANGSTTFAGVQLSAGPHLLTVQFTPTSNSYYGSAGSKNLVIVDPEATTLTVSSTPSFASGIYDGDSIDISVSASPAVSGSFTIVDSLNGTTVQSLTQSASGGSTTFNDFVLTGSGAHVLTITFTPASNFYTSSSSSNTVTVYDLTASRGWSAGALDS
jgi:hypothetical protein